MTVEIARHWRLNSQRYSLIGEECPTCHHKIFPPRDVCPYCAEEAGPEFHFGGKGTVFSHTTVHTPPEGFEAQSPYTVALIKLDEGPMITANSPMWTTTSLKLACPLKWSHANWPNRATKD